MKYLQWLKEAADFRKWEDITKGIVILFLICPSATAIIIHIYKQFKTNLLIVLLIVIVYLVWFLFIFTYSMYLMLQKRNE
jgi:RsiW-degrading membrane proteinase PrsW (M82 family)